MTPRTLTLITLTAGLAACASMEPLQTASGRPEVIVKGHTQQEVMEHLVAACASEGKMVENQTASMVTCSFAPDIMSQALFGTRGGSVLVKEQILLTKQAGGTRVTVPTAWMESVNGFGGVSRTPFEMGSGATAHNAQADLERMLKGL